MFALNLPLRQLLAGVPDERIRAARRAATATRPARRRPDPAGWLPRR